MTIWIYKSGILMADSLVTVDGVSAGSFKKITKTKDKWLAGGAGSVTDINKFLKWAERRDTDEAISMENLDGILVDPDGKVYSVETDMQPYVLENEFYCGGSGAKIAIGALAYGASVEKAISITCKYDRFCGGEIYKLML